MLKDLVVVRLRGGGKIGRDTTSGRSQRQKKPYQVSDTHQNSSRGVFCGNLSYETTWQALKDHMRQAGDIVRADVLIDRATGRSKGCGIVEYETASSARKAIRELHETELDGRPIFLREDRDDVGNRGNSSSSSLLERALSSPRSDAPSSQRRVYVGNLSWDVSWQDLKDYMRSVGDVIRVEIMTDSDGKSKGYGICEFSQERFAKKAIECLNETEFQGRVIYVREDIKNAADDRAAEVKGFERSKSKNSDNRSIYIWNLSYDTTKRELEDHFRRTGNIETATLLTGSDGRSLGCAVVAYQEAKGADRALRELDATMLDGREVRIREDLGHNENRPRDRKDTMNSSSCQLYVGNLSFQTTWQELKDHFRQCGRVDHVDVIEGPDGRKKGFGIVKFSTIDEAERAIDELDGVELDGRELDVRFDKRT